MKKCPYCAEEIRDEAIVCRYCGKDLRPKGTGFVVAASILRTIVGVVQSIIVLVGCAGLIIGNQLYVSAAIQWFIILCVIQLAILGGTYLFTKAR